MNENDNPESFTEEELLQICEDTLTVLSQCEINKISHRDIKPGNLLYKYTCDNLETLVADFGETGSRKDTLNTLARTIKGSPPYLSPELYYVYME